MSNSITYVVARLVAKPEKIEQLKAVLIELVTPTRAEKGCLRYELFQNQTDPSDFTFTEEWESEADLDNHSNSQHIQNALNQLDELVEAGPDIRRYYKLL